jgi:hypothetical protein
VREALSIAISKRSTPTMKPRTRVVYFRISEDEFTKFSNFCKAQGARSLSELARIAVYAMMQPSGKELEGSISQRLTDLEQSILELNYHLRTLTQVQANQSKPLDKEKL